MRFTVDSNVIALFHSLRTTQPPVIFFHPLTEIKFVDLTLNSYFFGQPDVSNISVSLRINKELLD